uniref:Uncharacterized protein n=1 Tax=Anguilla anguilla TaxID=7936 RepID=A0A0E9SYM4_ANGAN
MVGCISDAACSCKILIKKIYTYGLVELTVNAKKKQ